MKLICRNIILIFIITLLYSGKLYSQQQWSVINSPTGNNLWTVFFPDTLNGWIGGDSGIILNTSDNGANWINQNSGVNSFIRSVFFLNENTGFALSWEFDKTPPNYYGTRILSTTDGGNNWSNYLFRDTNTFLNSIYFTDNLNGYMGGSEGKLYYTSNSGFDWIRASTDSSTVAGFPVEEISFLNNTTGYAVGGSFDIAGIIWKTTNSGRNWKATIAGPEPLNDIYIFNPTDIICVGGDFEYGASSVITSNSGANWNYTELGVFGISRSIDFRIPGEGWIALGIVDSFLVTTNSGTDWNLRPTPGGSRLFSLTFTNTRNGWAVGQDGVILKYSSDFSGISNTRLSSPETSMLYQNFPNPFNPVTKIKYSVLTDAGSRYRNVELKVYDLTGKEVRVIVNEKKTSGEYEAEFDGSGLSSGIYYYTLITDKITADTKRMVLLK